MKERKENVKKKKKKSGDRIFNKHKEKIEVSWQRKGVQSKKDNILQCQRILLN